MVENPEKIENRLDKSWADSIKTEVGYEIKNQVKLFIGERSKTTFDSGCKMFDIFLKDAFQV